MVAPENNQEFIDSSLAITIFNRQFPINELWGSEETVKKLICDAFKNPDLFK